MMARAGLCCLFFLLSVGARAAPVLGAGAGLLLEQEGRSENYRARFPFFVRGGWAFGRLDAHLEYSTFAVSDGEGSVSIERRRHSWIGWGTWKFPSANRWIAPTASAGVGVIHEAVRTSVAAQSVTTHGRARLAAAAGVGVIVPWREGAELALDVRATASDESRPNPGLGASAGFNFRF